MRPRIGDQGERPWDEASQLRLTASSTAGQGSLIAPDAPATVDTITDTGFVRDPLISTAVAAITVVPEPRP